MEEIILEWKKFDSFAQLLKTAENWKAFKKPGVYMHVEKGPKLDRQFVGYVGRALGKLTLINRQLEHYRNFIGGLYNIPGEFICAKNDWYPGLRKMVGEIDKPGESIYFDVIFNEVKFKELLSALYRRANSQTIYLAVMDGTGKANRRRIEEVERTLIAALKPLRNGQLNWLANSEIMPIHEGELKEEQYEIFRVANDNFWKNMRGIKDYKKLRDISSCLDQCKSEWL